MYKHYANVPQFYVTQTLPQLVKYDSSLYVCYKSIMELSNVLNDYLYYKEMCVITLLMQVVHFLR